MALVRLAVGERNEPLEDETVADAVLEDVKQRVHDADVVHVVVARAVEAKTAPVTSTKRLLPAQTALTVREHVFTLQPTCSDSAQRFSVAVCSSSARANQILPRTEMGVQITQSRPDEGELQM